MCLVSVIIPNYNHSRYLDERINSVLEQTYKNYELIILDDFSNDDSRFIIEKYRNHPQITQIIYNECNSGSPFMQWNKGVEIAKGDLIWIAESDDMAQREFLETLIPFFNDQHIGLAYCQSLSIDLNGKVSGNWKSWTDELAQELFESKFEMNGLEYISSFLIYKNTIPNSSAVLFKKKILLQIGGVDETLKYCSDWLTWLKILSISNIAFSPKTLNGFRYHEQSVIATASRNMTLHSSLANNDLKLREKLEKYFIEVENISEGAKNIINKNKLLLIELKGLEGMSEIKKKMWLSGWVKIAKASFNKKINLPLLIQAAKLSAKTVIKRN